MDVTITESLDSCNTEHEPIDFQQCRKQWFMKYKDIVNGVLPELPPLQEVNHRIPLINENKQYYYHLPHCPDTMKPQLMEKLRKYTDTGWWILKAVQQAAPLLCIPKKMGKLHMVIDCRQHNDNTLKKCDTIPGSRPDPHGHCESKIPLKNQFIQCV